MTRRGPRLVIDASVFLLVVTTLALGQQPPSTRTVIVNDRAMRISTEGLARRKPGQPVVILESGTGGSLEGWEPVFTDISKMAPVFAYDRCGIGKSEFDGERPSVEHVSHTLHALLNAAHVPPPYVLVGHSWGGVYIRAFASAYPNDVLGLVYLDVTDWELTREEAAAFVPNRPVPPPLSAQLPDTLSPAVRAEHQQISDYASAGFSDIHALRVPSGLPVAVLIGLGAPASPPLPNAPAINVNSLRVFKLFQFRHQADWALASPAGLLLASTVAGHQVVRDVPALVVQAVKHVLDHVGNPAK